ncbi:MAG TPA: DUF4388 domain-containing protein [Ktedonobacterales bacterium]|nr:DUF4388 domain-containing protein [Ktedonobacterales bacterium]
MAQARAFQGRLEDFGLVDLLQAMSLDGKSGALHLSADHGGSGIVYFDQGAIVGAQEHDREALTLGAVLQQLQFASQQQMDYMFHLQTQDPLGKRIGERLVEQNIITPQQLEEALRRQTLWTIREMSIWKQGDYSFHKGERMPVDVVSPRIETTTAIMEALRYQHDWNALENVLIDGMRTNLAMAPDLPIDHPLQFHPSAWRIISRVNSQRTVRRIAISLRMPELDVARMVGPLVLEGLLIPSQQYDTRGRPDVAARIDLEHFDLFTLLISMEQTWIKCKSDADRLVALARFINETMQALAETYRANDVALATDTLATLLERHGIYGVGDYLFVIENNRIAIDDFAAYCRKVFDSSARAADGAPSPLFVEYRNHLEHALSLAFHAINARISSPAERVQNQEAWEALFMTFNS